MARKKRRRAPDQGRRAAVRTTAALRVSPVNEHKLHRIALVGLSILPFAFYIKYVLTGQALYGSDFLGEGSYFLRAFIAQNPGALWYPAIRCGLPTVGSFFADLYYPTFLFRLVLPVHVVWTWTFISHIFVAGLGTYLFLRQLRLDVIPALLGGISYMLCGSLMTLVYAGHDGRLMGTALLPFAMFFLHRGMTRRRFLWFALCGVIVALQLYSGHLQKVYYTGLILLVWFLFLWLGSIKAERSVGSAVRLAVYFAGGMGLAVALAAVQYLPVFGNMPFAARGQERGYAYATSWSMPLVETLDLVTPRFSGGILSYWGRNAFKLHSEYIGILPLLFAVTAVFRGWKNHLVRFFALAFGFTLLMAWGGETPFYHIPYHILPGISRVRGPAMIFYVGAFAVAVLAGFGIQGLLEGNADVKRSRLPRSVLVAGLAPAALLLVFATARGPLESLLRSLTAPASHKAAALAANWSNMLSGLAIASVVGLIGLGCIHLSLHRRVRPHVLAAVLAIVMVLDIGISLRLWDERGGYIKGVPPPAEFFAADDVARFIAQDKDWFRVLPLYYQVLRGFEGSGVLDKVNVADGILTQNGVQHVAGGHPNPLQTYQDFIGAGQSVMFQPGYLVHANFMNLLGVRYIIGPNLPDDISGFSERDQREIHQLRAVLSQPGIEPAARFPRNTVYRNSRALAHAFLVPAFEVVADKKEALLRLMQPGFDPRHTVLLYQEPGFTPADGDGSSAVGSAEVTDCDANSVFIQASAGVPCLLVLCDNFHPDWHAYVDGVRTEVLQAYHTLRAIRLEPGSHQVVFRYESIHYRLGLIVTLASIAFFVGTIVVHFATGRRRKQSA